jgi:putative ABC transport system permease protein
VLRSFERAVNTTSAGADFHVDGGGTSIDEALIAELQHVAGVALASGVVEGAVQLREHDDLGLMLLGVDLLAESSALRASDRARLETADELQFLAAPDSIAVPRELRERLGYDVGAAIDVISPHGPRTLVLRGTLDFPTLTSTFGGNIAVMDLPAAQLLLDKTGLVDRIDVHAAAGAARAELQTALAGAVAGRAVVFSARDRSGRAQDILISLRVILTLVGAIALAISYFIIYHTVTVSIAQRRPALGVLGAVGTAPWEILRWLVIEAVLIGTAASLLGAAGGVALAAASVRIFGTVTASWIAAPTTALQISPGPVIAAVAVGVLVSLIAALVACRQLFARTVLVLLSSRRGPDQPSIAPLRTQLVGLAAICLGAAMAAFAPRSLPYGPMVAFVLVTNCCIMIGAALLAGLPANAIGRAAERLGARMRGTTVLLAASNLVRRPANATAVIIAIVMAVAATLANGSVIASFKNSWFAWFDRFYDIDVVVTAEGSATSILTARPFSDEVVARIASLDGVTQVQGIRRIGALHDARPIMLLAIDSLADGLPLTDRDWPTVAADFRNGDAYLVSDTLAYRSGLHAGDRIALLSPTGPVDLPVAGVFKDVYGGDLGAVALERGYYAERWRDHTVDRIAVRTSAAPQIVQETINRKLAAPYAVHAISFRASLDELQTLVNDAFRLSYGLIFICLTVSAVGILRLVTAVLVEISEEWETNKTYLNMETD